MSPASNCEQRIGKQPAHAATLARVATHKAHCSRHALRRITASGMPCVGGNGRSMLDTAACCSGWLCQGSHVQGLCCAGMLFGRTLSCA